MDCEIDFIDNDDSQDYKAHRPLFKKKPINKQGKQQNLKKAFGVTSQQNEDIDCRLTVVRKKRSTYPPKKSKHNPEESTMSFAFQPSQHFLNNQDDSNYPELGQEDGSTQGKKKNGMSANKMWYQKNRMFVSKRKKGEENMTASQAYSNCGIG